MMAVGDQLLGAQLESVGVCLERFNLLAGLAPGSNLGRSRPLALALLDSGHAEAIVSIGFAALHGPTGVIRHTHP